MVYTQAAHTHTHTCGWLSVQTTCSREFYRREKGRVVLYPSPAAEPLSSLSVSYFLSVSSLCLPMQAVAFPLLFFFSGEIWLTCQGAKGNLFCTSSMPRVTDFFSFFFLSFFFLRTAPPKNVKQKIGANKDILQRAYSLCSGYSSQETFTEPGVSHILLDLSKEEEPPLMN